MLVARFRCALLQIPVNGGFGKHGDRGEGMRGPRGSIPGDCQRHEGKLNLVSDASLLKRRCFLPENTTTQLDHNGVFLVPV